MNLYLWCKDTQKYSDCGIRKYKKNKTGGISGYIINYRELTRDEADEFESSFMVINRAKSNHYFSVLRKSLNSCIFAARFEIIINSINSNK